MGFLFEAEYQLTLGFPLAKLSIDPAFSIGLRDSDGLVQMGDLARNVTITGSSVAEAYRDQVDRGLAGAAPAVAQRVNDTLSIPVAQLTSAVGLPDGLVNTSCSTPTPAAPSDECRGNVLAALRTGLESLGIDTPLTEDAMSFLQAIHFSCDDTLQCRFHPVFQAVNVLPDSLEVVLAPDLRDPSDPINGPLTSFFSLVGPVSLSQTVNVGGTPFTATIDCSVPPVATQSGHIVTVFNEGGDPDLAAGIPCAPFSQP